MKKSKGIILLPKLGSDFQSPPHQLSKKQKLNTSHPAAAAVNEEIEIQQHGEDLSDFPFDYENNMKNEEKLKIEMKPENDNQPKLQCNSKQFLSYNHSSY